MRATNDNMRALPPAGSWMWHEGRVWCQDSRVQLPRHSHLNLCPILSPPELREVQDFQAWCGLCSHSHPNLAGPQEGGNKIKNSLSPRKKIKNRFPLWKLGGKERKRGKQNESSLCVLQGRERCHGYGALCRPGLFHTKLRPPRGANGAAPSPICCSTPDLWF